MPIKVAVFNRKGGVGKTTLSIILTQIALMNGKKVLAVDQDEQANFSVSVRYLQQEINFMNSFTLKTSLSAEDLNTTADWLIVDCPPAFGERSRFALRNSDLILIPTRPDYYATMPFNAIRETAGDGKYPFQFLLAKVGFAGNLTSRLANATVESFRNKGYPVVADLPLFATIPANISSNRKKWWRTGLQASARRPYEHLYSQLERYYGKLQDERRRANDRPYQGDDESSEP